MGSGTALLRRLLLMLLLLALLRRLSEIGAQGLVSLGAVEIQESLDW